MILMFDARCRCKRGHRLAVSQPVAAYGRYEAVMRLCQTQTHNSTVVRRMNPVAHEIDTTRLQFDKEDFR